MASAADVPSLCVEGTCVLYKPSRRSQAFETAPHYVAEALHCCQNGMRSAKLMHARLVVLLKLLQGSDELRGPCTGAGRKQPNPLSSTLAKYFSLMCAQSVCGMPSLQASTPFTGARHVCYECCGQPPVPPKWARTARGPCNTDLHTKHASVMHVTHLT